VLAQEARRERLERLVERRLNAQAEAQHAMEGEPAYRPHVLHNQSDQWEALELARINAGRVPSRTCTRLPARSYDATRCNRYANRGDCQ
jgi:hypothetical protein